MNKRLRFGVTLLLMLCFCISALAYLFFDIAQFDLKLASQGRIRASSHLQTIKLPARQFASHEKELWHNGRLYDIHSFVIKNDTACISVLPDKDEEQLIKNISDSFEPDNCIAPDNLVHIARHHAHAPAGGKILVARYVLRTLLPFNFNSPMEQGISFCSSACFDVIKPPPRPATIFSC